MKSQLLTLFLFAAPLLVHVLSRDSSLSAAGVEAQPAVESRAATESAAKPAPVKRPAKSGTPIRRIPASHAFTFM